MNALARTCMHDRIRDTLVSRILANHYPPGTHLKELALAREFDVSQAPVREALRELEALGLVVSERYKGTRVRNPDTRELGDAYELRAILEQRAAELAVPCRKADLAKLREILADMESAAHARNNTGYAAATVRFHRQIVAMSRNAVFLKTWESMLWDVRARVAVQLLAYNHAPFVDLHADVIAALEQGDGIQAGGLLRRLLEIPQKDLQKNRHDAGHAATTSS